MNLKFKLIVIGIMTFSLNCKTTQNIKHKKVDQSDRMEFDSMIPAKAGKGKIPGMLHYKTYRLESEKIPIRKIRSCYFQHGYGVDNTFVRFKRLTFDNFVHIYFGLSAIDKLLKTVCGEVIVVMQESNLTTILEMTQRSERFLKNIVCRPDDGSFTIKYQKTCAFIGHSKGGAVAFNIARRCMNKTSEMGYEGCSRLAEIYSATGVIQGAMATFAVYGAYLGKGKEEQEAFVKVLGFGVDMVIPLYEPYKKGETNPTWVDLNPGAPMENGIPLYIINDIELKKTGWLVADFAASGVQFLFKGDGKENLLGCGKKDRTDLSYDTCSIFGRNVALVHSNKLKQSFEKGLAQAKKDFFFFYQNKNDYFKEMSWNRFQMGDGLADYYLSINACQKGLRVKENPAVKSCTTFLSMNHLAATGQNPMAIADIVKQLAD
ncbi:MAG: hypothetical protein H7A23_18345 [Leptospiraceae bacterium]|nr:hypothetical protein [Leptospiraceae bacterium]MCP5496511.1 hypothetical protein [Leptospiraceae bacterium]